MAIHEQSQPKGEASVRTHNNDSIPPPANQQQEEEEEEEEEQTFNPAAALNDDYASNSIGAIVAVNEPHTRTRNANNNKKYNYHSFPPGYRFCPFDLELVNYYLIRRVGNLPLPHDMIKEVNLYMHNPDYFAVRYEALGEKEWYFFTPRDRKYLKGSRPSRKAGDGYWKATGADKPIKLGSVIVGYKKSLVFYLGKPPKGDKTDWIMHEYRLNAPPRKRKNANDMRLDDWVLCRVYKKPKKSNKAKQQEQDQPEPDKYSAAALTDEKTPPPCVNDNNNVVEMNWDYNDSSQFINTCSDFFQSPSLDEILLGMPTHLTDAYACLPSVHHHPTSHIPFQNELLQTPIQNFSVPHQHQQPTSFYYGSRPIGSVRPFMSRYIQEEEKHGLDSSSRTRKPQEDTWNIEKLEQHAALHDFPLPNYVEPYPSLDNLQPSNIAPGSPYNFVGGAKF